MKLKGVAVHESIRLGAKIEIKKNSKICRLKESVIILKCNIFLLLFHFFSLLKPLIKQKISRPITTGALLTLIAIGRNLQEIHVGKSYVITKCDEWLVKFGQNNNLDTRWMQENFDTYDRVQCAISKNLSKSWRFSNY